MGSCFYQNHICNIGLCFGRFCQSLAAVKLLAWSRTSYKSAVNIFTLSRLSTVRCALCLWMCAGGCVPLCFIIPHFLYVWWFDMKVSALSEEMKTGDSGGSACSVCWSQRLPACSMFAWQPLKGFDVLISFSIIFIMSVQTLSNHNIRRISSPVTIMWVMKQHGGRGEKNMMASSY